MGNKKNIEQRYYKITGFRDLGDGNIRVILDPYVKNKPKQIDANTMMQNPFGFAQDLMQNQMTQMIHDTFLISRNEYFDKRYTVGEIIKVSIEKTDLK